MPEYRVSIPLEPIPKTMVRARRRGGVVDGLEIPGVLRIRDEDETIFVDMSVQDESADEAVEQAVLMAQRLVHLIAAFHFVRLGLDLYHIRVVEPGSKEEGWTASIEMSLDVDSLERVGRIWKGLDALRTHTDRGDLALDWMYFGTLADDERDGFLAFWIALEILVEDTADEDGSPSVIRKQIPEDDKVNELRQKLSAVLRCYMDEEGEKRILSYINQARAESNADRWTRILRAKGIQVADGEVRHLQEVRGQIVHAGVGQNLSEDFTRLQQLVRECLVAALRSA